jgi:hypothetical protein
MNRIRAIAAALVAPLVMGCTVLSAGCDPEPFDPPVLSEGSFFVLCHDACMAREICFESTCTVQCMTQVETLYPHCSGPAFDYWACQLEIPWTCDADDVPQPSDACLVEAGAVLQCLVDWTVQG